VLLYALMVIKQVALQEVVSRVLSEPIRPQFAIANVIESGVEYLSETLYLVRFSIVFYLFFCYKGKPQTHGSSERRLWTPVELQIRY
jgi:hypothetical protein